MQTENSESNATTSDVNLDDFARELFGQSSEPVQEDVQIEEGADDTSPSDADETKPVETEAEAEPESNEGDDETPEEPVEKPRKKTAAERISEVVGERNAARDELAALRAELEALKAPAPAPKEDTPIPAKPDDGPAAPDPDERLENGELKYPLGEYDAEYLADRVDYLFAKKEAEAEARRAEAERVNQAQQEANQLQTNWEARLVEAEATEEMKDIREQGAILVSELQESLTPEHGDFLGKTIMSMEKGAEVFYFLATNPDVARAIAAQDPISATIALGGLQERVRAAKTEAGNPKPRVTHAPEPPKTVNRGTNGRFETPDDTEDLDAFARKLFMK